MCCCPQGADFLGQAPGTWGTSFGAKRGPPHPPKSPKGGKFRFFPPLETPFQRPREGDCGPPPIGSLPKLSFRRIGDLRPALCGRSRHGGGYHPSSCVDRGGVISANFFSVPHKQTHGCGAKGMRERNAARADFGTPGLDLRAFLGGVGWPFFGPSKNGPPQYAGIEKTNPSNKWQGL